MRMSLWWIPRAHVDELSATDLAVLRMCRVVTLFLIVAIAYFGSLLLLGGEAREERDRLLQQISRCGCAESRSLP